MSKKIISAIVKPFLEKLVKLLQANRLLFIPCSQYNLFDLEDLDSRYRKMYESHINAHTGLIQEMQKFNFKNVLEVACGSGWNIPNFQKTGIKYYGLDISETAISIAMLKHPENRYLNLGVCDCEMIADESFDVVYSSSMLEHIGYHQEAIKEMVRLAKKEVWILFFEGLSDEDDHKISFNPYTESYINSGKDLFGRKIVLQDHIHEKNKGWYWNRYSKKKVLDLFDQSIYRIELLDRGNRSFLEKETLLIVRKEA